jgi:hypothetical protein
MRDISAAKPVSCNTDDVLNLHRACKCRKMPANERHATLLTNQCRVVFNNPARDVLRINGLRLPSNVWGSDSDSDCAWDFGLSLHACSRPADETNNGQ